MFVLETLKSWGLSSIVDSFFYYVYVISTMFDNTEEEIEMKVNEEDKIKRTRYNIDTGMIEIEYVMDNKKYVLSFHRSNTVAANEARQVLIQDNLFKDISDVKVNGEDRLKALFNEYYGPMGDFHTGLTSTPLRVRDILPKEEWETFQSLNLMNSDVEFFDADNLDTVIEFM